MKGKIEINIEVIELLIKMLNEIKRKSSDHYALELVTDVIEMLEGYLK
jgi:hypothetical protein